MSREEHDFPGKLSRRVLFANEKVVRERLHNRHSSTTFPRIVGGREVQKSAQLCRHDGNDGEKVGWVGHLIYDDGACCAGRLSSPGGRKTRSVIYRGDKRIGEVDRLPIEEPTIRGRFSAVICLFKFFGAPNFSSLRVRFGSAGNCACPTIRMLLLLELLLFGDRAS